MELVDIVAHMKKLTLIKENVKFQLVATELRNFSKMLPLKHAQNIQELPQIAKHAFLIHVL